jgi:hypothetical protein
MKTERWGNDADGQFQGLTASKFLPRLTQDAFLLGGRYADTLPKNCQRARWEFDQIQRHRSQLSDTHEQQRTRLNFPECVIPSRYTSLITPIKDIQKCFN